MGPAYAVWLDILAFGGAGRARDRIGVCKNSLRQHVRALGSGRRLCHFGDRLHRQDDLKPDCAPKSTQIKKPHQLLADRPVL